MVSLIEEAHLLHGYLENQVFAPAVRRAKELLWQRAVPSAGRPYLVRRQREHSGPHEEWFWQTERQGGGAMLDMMCHSVETGRFLLTEPGSRAVHSVAHSGAGLRRRLRKSEPAASRRAGLPAGSASALHKSRGLRTPRSHLCRRRRSDGPGGGELLVVVRGAPDCASSSRSNGPEYSPE